jgi:hypothetical protein
MFNANLHPFVGGVLRLLDFVDFCEFGELLDGASNLIDDLVYSTIIRIICWMLLASDLDLILPAAPMQPVCGPSCFICLRAVCLSAV